MKSIFSEICAFQSCETDPPAAARNRSAAEARIFSGLDHRQHGRAHRDRPAAKLARYIGRRIDDADRDRPRERYRHSRAGL